MQQWEYKTLQIDTEMRIFNGTEVDIDTMNTAFNRLGSAGWELVSMVDINHGEGRSIAVIATFKRPTD